MNKTIRTILIIIVIAVSSAIIRTIHKDDVKISISNTNNNSVNDTLLNNNSTQNISRQLWFKNPQYGLSFETPHKIIEDPFIPLPRGTSDYITNRYSYTFHDDDYIVSYQVLEINPSITEFDSEAGLKGAVGNSINGLKNGGGSQLNLEFSEIKNNYNNKLCDGTFYYMNERMRVKGYCLFKDSKGYTLIGFGKDNETANEKLNRTFESIYIIGDTNSFIKGKIIKSNP